MKMDYSEPIVFGQVCNGWFSSFGHLAGVALIENLNFQWFATIAFVSVRSS